MNNAEFRIHFENACKEINAEDYENIKFVANPVYEEGKKYSSTDDIMRLWFFPKRRECDFETVVKLLTWKEGYYPLWIKIRREEDRIILDISYRMRKAGDRNDGYLYPFIICR